MICSPLTGYIALRLCPQAILHASGEQIVMSPSLKGNNCIKTNDVFKNDSLMSFYFRYQRPQKVVAAPIWQHGQGQYRKQKKNTSHFSHGV